MRIIHNPYLLTWAYEPKSFWSVLVSLISYPFTGERILPRLVATPSDEIIFIAPDMLVCHPAMERYISEQLSK